MSQWRRLKERLSKSDFGTSRVLLGLDFDGTLAELAQHPDHAALSDRTRRVLAALARRRDVAVAVLSGRDLADVRRLIALDGVYYAGNHGLQIEGPGFRWTHPLARRFDARFLKRLEIDVGEIPGAFLERKRLGVSVHYRAVPARHHRKLFDRVRTSVDGLRERYRLLRGKKTLDIRLAVPWDKGRAFETIRECLPGGWLGLFVGDDLTDEEGFRTLGARALTIRVGRVRETSAQYVLRHRGLVDRLLETFAARPLED